MDGEKKRRVRREVRVLTSEEIERLLLVRQLRARDPCVIGFMALAGLRMGEVLGLDYGDIKWHDERYRVRVERPKGYQRMYGPSKPREILMMKRLEYLYERWILERGKHPGPLFVTKNGKRLDPSHFRHKLPSMARRAGIEGRVHPHCFRHSFAAHFYRHTRDIVALAKILGHSSILTTQQYLFSIGVQPELDAMVELASW